MSIVFIDYWRLTASAAMQVIEESLKTTLDFVAKGCVGYYGEPSSKHKD